VFLAYYRDCLKRHLYVHGPDRVLLSKNAAYAGMAQGLADQFPDARFIVCLRGPAETVPSQLSSIADGLEFFGVPADSAPIRARLIDQLAFYYENLAALSHRLPAERHAALGLTELRAGLAPALTRIYAQLRLDLSPDFARTLAVEDGRARGYRSRHRYSLEQFGLDAEQIGVRFARAYDHPVLAAALTESAVPNGRDSERAEPVPAPKPTATSRPRCPWIQRR
jgi:hypothetical protein